jgi:hypothetical protein
MHACVHMHVRTHTHTHTHRNRIKSVDIFIITHHSDVHCITFHFNEGRAQHRQTGLIKRCIFFNIFIIQNFQGILAVLPVQYTSVTSPCSKQSPTILVFVVVKIGKTKNLQVSINKKVELLLCLAKGT